MSPTLSSAAALIQRLKPSGVVELLAACKNPLW